LYAIREISFAPVQCPHRIRAKESAMKVVAINGSGRKDGNTYLLLKTVLDELEAEGFQTEVLQLAGGKPLQGCVSCYKCMEKKNMKCVIETIRSTILRPGEPGGRNPADLQSIFPTLPRDASLY
jgi:hypothetical protein